MDLGILFSTSIAWVSFIRIRRYGILFFNLQCEVIYVLKRRRMNFPWTTILLVVTALRGTVTGQGRSAAVYDCNSLTVASIFKAPLFFFSSPCISKLCLQGDSHQLHLFQSLPEQPLSQKIDPLISATLSGGLAMVASTYYLPVCEGLRERWKSSKTFGKNG